MNTVLVFGNPDLAMDALPLSLVEELHRVRPDLSFVVKDPNEDWNIPRTLMVIDTVVGIDRVQDKRVVYLGKLATIHGHEYRGGGGVNPARWLMQRAYTSAMCGHFHRASFHGTKGLNPKPIGIWSHGCACYLHPGYGPLNEWTHGFASVELAPDGTFHVENKMVIDGRLT
jgi:hypothetical protein